MATAHREVVEQVLPKVDAVAWITDPEKYHDTVLYDDFLRRWLTRLARQAIVVNKADRLSGDDVARVRLDLEGDVRHGLAGRSGRDDPTVPIIAVSATGGSEGIRAFSEWLAEGVESKIVVRARVAATIAAHAKGLAREAGIDPAGPAEPFLNLDARRTAIGAVTAAMLRAIDLPGLQRQAVAATRAQARRRGTGPIGTLTSLIYRLSGREAQVADPDGIPCPLARPGTHDTCGRVAPAGAGRADFGRPPQAFGPRWRQPSNRSNCDATWRQRWIVRSLGTIGPHPRATYGRGSVSCRRWPRGPSRCRSVG